MGKIKIHEIAKKLGLTSKEVLDAASNLQIEAKSHLSGVTEEEAKKIEEKLSKKDKNNENRKENKKENKKETSKEKEQKAPVIIRREVIITEEQNKKTEEKKDEKKNNVGFVERRQNKDFNIVYRNKPNKPKTVSELFGLNKEEPPKKEEPKQEKKRRKSTRKNRG